MRSNSSVQEPKDKPGSGLLSTLKGRFIAVAVGIAIVVLVSAGLAYSLTQSAGKQALSNASARQQLDSQLHLISEGITRSEAALLNYMIEPTATGRQAVTDAMNMTISGIPGLANARLLQNDTELRLNFDRLARDLPELLDQANHLMIIRADIEQLYPASPLLIGQMLVSHTEFSANSSLALQDARLNRDKPGQVDVAEALNDIRYAWTNRIGAFRLYVANRSGLFGAPGTAMAGQRANINMFGETIDRGLTKLKLLNDRGILRFEQEDAFERMVKAKKEWDQTYLEATKIYESENWRTDIPLLKNRIQPLFSRVHVSVSALKSKLSALADTDLMELGNTGSKVMSYIWFLGICFALFVIPAYYAFCQIVQKPLAKIVNAIEAETRGDTHVELPDAQVEETRALVRAFAEMRERVQSRQQRLSAILDNAAEGIITFDENGRIESFNNAAESLFGYNEKEILGKEISYLMPPGGRERRAGYMEHFMRYQINRLIGHEDEVVGRHKNGSRFPMALKVSSMEIEGKKLFTGLVADISERKAMVEHLKQVAEHDGLTGLYNRTYFQDELERVIERAQRDPDSRYAVLYLDLDNFKFVNDTMGHAAGDKLLIEIADMLSRRARSGDLMARFGGDEFTILLFDVGPDMAVDIAESFRQRMAEYHFRYEGREVDVGCSIGIAAVTMEVDSADEILSRADFACNMAKRQGRNRVHLFIENDKENMNNLSLDMGWSRRIKQAIEQDHFVLVTQPIINTATREIECYEVLLRLLDENNEIFVPAGFLPAAERFGLAADIDRWVITNAIDSLAKQRRSNPGLRYAINLSGQTLTDHSICDLIHNKINESGLDPEALTFEVTETVAIADMPASVDFLSRLHAIGCKTALDDFGSGMSSFAYLQDLPVDIVKIDGRFVKNISENHVDQAMVKAMNEIAHALGKQTVAEFVENEAAMNLLTEYGIDYAQGFHLGKPGPVPVIEQKGRKIKRA